MFLVSKSGMPTEDMLIALVFILNKKRTLMNIRHTSCCVRRKQKTGNVTPFLFTLK